ncbi:MAG: hypothetical protein JSR77_10625 [Planctomycetes bacterium]|nr:hypothetical protein [Planctomycetota bacterium]
MNNLCCVDSPSGPQDSGAGVLGTNSYCPHCDYALTGLPRGTAACPECGGSLSAAAYARAAAQRIARSTGARLALLISPGVAIVGGAPVFVFQRNLVYLLMFLFACLWIGGTIAIYYSTLPRRRELWKAALLGLPLGLAYFLAVGTTALVVVLVIKFVFYV